MDDSKDGGERRGASGPAARRGWQGGSDCDAARQSWICHAVSAYAVSRYELGSNDRPTA